MLLAWKTRTVGVVAKLTVVAFVPSGSGRELREERPLPTRVVMLAERGTERAGWESSVADDIEGERGSQEKSNPSGSGRTGWVAALEIDPPGLGKGGERTGRNGGDPSVGSMGVVVGEPVGGILGELVVGELVGFDTTTAVE
jgi:hypothetical protein